MGANADLSFLENYKAVKARLRNPRVQDALATLFAPLVQLPPAQEPEIASRDSDQAFDPGYGPPNITRPLDRARFILTGMARWHGVSKNDITSIRRQIDIIPARFEAIYLVKESTPWSLPHIGRFFGGRDHTTIIHALRSHESSLKGEKYIQPHRRPKVSTPALDGHQARIDAGEAPGAGPARERAEVGP